MDDPDDQFTDDEQQDEDYEQALLEPGELTDSQKIHIRELFDDFDKVKKDGYLSTSELRKGLQLMGLNPTQKDILGIQKRHKMKGRKCDFETWEKIVAEEILSKTNQEFDLLQAFKVFDKDDSNTLDRSELRRCLSTIGEKMPEDEIDAIFDMCDVDKDGQLNFLEFAKVLA